MTRYIFLAAAALLAVLVLWFVASQLGRGMAYATDWAHANELAAAAAAQNGRSDWTLIHSEDNGRGLFSYIYNHDGQRFDVTVENHGDQWHVKTTEGLPIP